MLLAMEDELSECAHNLRHAMSGMPDSPTMNRARRELTSRRRQCNELSDEAQRLARALQKVIMRIEENEDQIVRMVEDEDVISSRGGLRSVRYMLRTGYVPFTPAVMPSSALVIHRRASLLRRLIIRRGRGYTPIILPVQPLPIVTMRSLIGRGKLLQASPAVQKPVAALPSASTSIAVQSAVASLAFPAVETTPVS